MSVRRTRAFTLVEVVAALAVASIALLSLLRLHLVSISMADRVEAKTQAIHLAQEKMAETLAQGYPEAGTITGTTEKNNLHFDWRTQVADLRLPSVSQGRLTGLRTIRVDVTWSRGSGQSHLQMATYVADRRIP
jgi:general secretion pathway protein I